MLPLTLFYIWVTEASLQLLLWLINLQSHMIKTQELGQIWNCELFVCLFVGFPSTSQNDVVSDCVTAK